MSAFDASFPSTANIIPPQDSSEVLPATEIPMTDLSHEQRALLAVIAEHNEAGVPFFPFASVTVQRVVALAVQMGLPTRPCTRMFRQALDDLQAMGLVVRSNLGEYSMVRPARLTGRGIDLGQAPILGFCQSLPCD